MLVLQKKQTSPFCYGVLIFLLTGITVFCPSAVSARELDYSGNEATIYVEPGAPTQISYPGKVAGGYKKKKSNLTIEKQDDALIIFAQPELTDSGEAIIVHLEDKRSYAFRVKPATPLNPRDELITIKDIRDPVIDTEEAETKQNQPRDFAPPSAVSGFMRELILVAEFGKKKGIPGYRRSNRYTDEVVLHDGAIEAKIEEIFMGTDLWGYVVTVKNLLNTTQRLNPASFRLDGTRAISAERWELAPQPITAEQQAAQAHIGRLYIITKASRR